YLHASMALLALFPMEAEQQKKYLNDRMLKSTNHTECYVICEALREYSGERFEHLWGLMENDPNPERRFRAACALARYDEHNPQWAKYIDEIAMELATKDRLVEGWFSMMNPIRDDIANSLLRILRDPTRPESERSRATSAYIHAMKISVRAGG